MTGFERLSRAFNGGGSPKAVGTLRESRGQDQSSEASKTIGLLSLSLIAVAVGVVTGIGAVAFRALIGFIHNVFFLGQFSTFYDANVYTPASPWGIYVIFVPVVGGLAVTFLVNTFAPEARGHGVPEVMDAIYYKEGVIRPVVAAVKSLASALSIGAGAAVGREGPIIQIGSSLGSTAGQAIGMAAWQRITLVGAGAGAGIAATFNTPIGGVMFAIELMMPEVSVRTFLPVALSTGAATFVGRFFLGIAPAFHVDLPAESLPASIYVLLLYAFLGAIAGFGATAFIRGLHLAEDVFEHISNSYLRHAIGMLIVGVMIYVLFISFGQYYVEGVGYAAIQDILNGGLIVPGLLGILFICKLIATSVSLGSGASGGIFSPALFMGATLGGMFGAVLHSTYPVAGIDVTGSAIIGMAAMVGGATGAAMTAITMLFEMTRDYSLVMPMIVAVAIAIGIRRLLSRENIYTIKLVGRRHFVPKALHANMFLVRHASDVMDRNALVLPAKMGFDEFLRRPELSAQMQHVVVSEGDRIVGVQRVNIGLRRGLAGTGAGVTLGEVARKDFTIARADDVLFNVIQRMWRRGATMAVVVSGAARKPRANHVVGVISKEHVADSVADSIKGYGSRL
ncbi:MAG: chloride channel protein [Rhodomicrobium sp.]